LLVTFVSGASGQLIVEAKSWHSVKMTEFCEENYAVHPSIREFWAVMTNLPVMICSLWVLWREISKSKFYSSVVFLQIVFLFVEVDGCKIHWIDEDRIMNIHVLIISPIVYFYYRYKRYYILPAFGLLFYIILLRLNINSLMYYILIALDCFYFSYNNLEFNQLVTHTRFYFIMHGAHLVFMEIGGYLEGEGHCYLPFLSKQSFSNLRLIVTPHNTCGHMISAFAYWYSLTCIFQKGEDFIGNRIHRKRA